MSIFAANGKTYDSRGRLIRRTHDDAAIDKFLVDITGHVISDVRGNMMLNRRPRTNNT